MGDKKEKQLYTEMNTKWKDFRLDGVEPITSVGKKLQNEVIDKRALAWLADAFVISLIGNHKTGIHHITKGQDIVRKYVNPDNFDKAHSILFEELSMALRRAMLKIENL